MNVCKHRLRGESNDIECVKLAEHDLGHPARSSLACTVSCKPTLVSTLIFVESCGDKICILLAGMHL